MAMLISKLRKLLVVSVELIGPSGAITPKTGGVLMPVIHSVVPTIAIFGSGASVAQTPAPTKVSLNTLQQVSLGELPPGKWNMKAVMLVIEPGGEIPFHVHSGPGLRYVLEGAITIKWKEGKTQTFKAPALPISKDANVCTSAKVNTDEGTQYNWMKNQYEHDLVKHSIGEYVRGETYTNTIESAFGHFKRCILGCYQQVTNT